MTTTNRLYPYRLMLDLPTAHLMPGTREWVERQARETARNGTEGGSVLDVGYLPHGWFLRVRDDVADRIPADLQDCMAKAAELGAFAILFDTDADVSPLTGDLPVYDEDGVVVAREDYDGPTVGAIEVYTLSCADPGNDPHLPCHPSVILGAAAAEAAFKEALRGEWASSPPEDRETCAPLPFPEEKSADEIHEAMVAFHGTSWGHYLLCNHLIRPVAPSGAEPAPQAAPADSAAVSAEDEPRILANFVPQAWQNDNAVGVDPEGETTFDVTDTVTAMGREAALGLRDNRDETDHLSQDENAPDWIRSWAGPYYVEVEESVREYYAAIDAAAARSAA